MSIASKRITTGALEAALERALELGEIGIQVAVYAGNELIVDAWAGTVDLDSDDEVSGSTIFPVFSVTKALTATALHIQADRGLVDYDAPVGRYWPEYARNGKEAVTVGDVLTHRTGAPQMPPGATPERLSDWDWVVDGLAALSPLFPRGTSAYHSFSWGWLVGEIVRRTDPARRPFAQFFDEEIARPCGLDDAYLGLPESELERVATLADEPSAEPLAGRWELTFEAPIAASAEIHNLPAMQRAVHPGAGVIANARSIARFFSILANLGETNDSRLLSEGTLRAACRPRERADEVDAVAGMTIPIGERGYWVSGFRPAGFEPAAGAIMGYPKTVLWHPGAGGSYGWADLDCHLGVAICHNRMFNSIALPASENPFVAIGKAARAAANERSIGT